MTEWKVESIGDVCSFITDGSHNPPKGISQSEYFMLSSKDIQDGHLVFNNPRFLSEKDFEIENNRTKLQLDDVLLTTVGTIGRTAIYRGVPAKVTFQRSVSILRPMREKITPQYLKYFFDSITHVLTRESRGVAQQGIYLNQLKKIQVSYPPLPEQQKIVELLEDHLSRLDAALADVKQAKAKAAQFRRSLLQSIFEGQYSKNSDLWGRKAIGDFAEVKGGKRLPKGTKWSLKPTSHPYIRATDIKCGQIKTQELVHVPDSVWKSISRYIVEENDVLITIAGTIGEIAVVPSGLAGANLTENAAKLVFDHNFVLPSYLSMYLQSPNVQNEFKKLSRATTQSKLALYRIATVEVPIPSLDEQQQIMELIDEKLSYLTSSLSQISAIELHATSLRRSLLQAAFTGQLTKEVASV